MTDMTPPLQHRLHHVGIAVENLDAAIQSWVRGYGAVAAPDTFQDERQQVRIRFLLLGDARLELIEPLSPDSHLHQLIRRGIGMYHVCYETPDLDATLADLQARGTKVISPPKPAAAFDGRRVAFTLREGLMIEWLEQTAGQTSG